MQVSSHLSPVVPSSRRGHRHRRSQAISGDFDLEGLCLPTAEPPAKPDDLHFNFNNAEDFARGTSGFSFPASPLLSDETFTSSNSPETRRAYRKSGLSSPVALSKPRRSRPVPRIIEPRGTPPASPASVAAASPGPLLVPEALIDLDEIMSPRHRRTGSAPEFTPRPLLDFSQDPELDLFAPSYPFTLFDQPSDELLEDVEEESEEEVEPKQVRAFYNFSGNSSASSFASTPLSALNLAPPVNINRLPHSRIKTRKSMSRLEETWKEKAKASGIYIGGSSPALGSTPASAPSTAQGFTPARGTFDNPSRNVTPTHGNDTTLTSCDASPGSPTQSATFTCKPQELQSPTTESSTSLYTTDSATPNPTLSTPTTEVNDHDSAMAGLSCDLGLDGAASGTPRLGVTMGLDSVRFHTPKERTEHEAKRDVPRIHLSTDSTSTLKVSPVQHSYRLETQSPESPTRVRNRGARRPASARYSLTEDVAGVLDFTLFNPKTHARSKSAAPAITSAVAVRSHITVTGTLPKPANLVLSPEPLSASPVFKSELLSTEPATPKVFAEPLRLNILLEKPPLPPQCSQETLKMTSPRPTSPAGDAQAVETEPKTARRKFLPSLGAAKSQFRRGSVYLSDLLESHSRLTMSLRSRFDGSNNDAGSTMEVTSVVSSRRRSLMAWIRRR